MLHARTLQHACNGPARPRARAEVCRAPTLQRKALGGLGSVSSRRPTLLNDLLGHAHGTFDYASRPSPGVGPARAVASAPSPRHQLQRDAKEAATLAELLDLVNAWELQQLLLDRQTERLQDLAHAMALATFRLCTWEDVRVDEAAGLRPQLAAALRQLQAGMVPVLAAYDTEEAANTLWALATWASRAQRGGRAAAGAAPGEAPAGEEGGAPSDGGGGSGTSGSLEGPWVEAGLLDGLAEAWAAQHPLTPATAPEHLVSILWGFGQLSALLRQQQLQAQRQQQQEQQQREEPAAAARAPPPPPLPPSSEAHARLLDGACAALADQFNDPTISAAHWASGGSVLQPGDLTDMAVGLAAAQRRSPAAARLLDCVAGEVHTQLSNRHSANAPFLPEDLCKLAAAFADLAYTDGPVPRMLDAVATYVVKRIRGGHLGAVSRPDHAADLLQAYARLGHASVVVPELIGALSGQVCQEATAALEAQAAGRPPAVAITLGLAAGLLRAQLRLGYLPPATQLLALLPVVAPHVPGARLADVAHLLLALAEARFHPGDRVVDGLLAEAARQQGDLAAPTAATLLYACAQLGCGRSFGSGGGGSDGGGLLAHAADLVALGEGDGLDMAGAFRALWGMCALGLLDIRRFGWLCVRIGGLPWSRASPPQLQVLAQAAALLGQEGWEMAEEVLPAQLLASCRAAAQQLAREQAAAPAVRARQERVSTWLRRLAEAQGAGSLSTPARPETPGPAGWRVVGADALSLQDGVALPGAWRVQLAGASPADHDGAGGAALTSASSGTAQLLLLVCPDELYSANEPHRPGGGALLNKQLALAACRQDGGTPHVEACSEQEGAPASGGSSLMVVLLRAGAWEALSSGGGSDGQLLALVLALACTTDV